MANNEQKANNNKQETKKQSITLKNIGRFKEAISTEDGIKYVLPGEEIEVSDKDLIKSLLKTKRFKKV